VRFKEEGQRKEEVKGGEERNRVGKAKGHGVEKNIVCSRKFQLILGCVT